MLKPAGAFAAGARFAEAYCDIEGAAPGMAGDFVSGGGGAEGSGALATIAPFAVRAASAATGGAAGPPGVVATQRVFAAGAASRPFGLGISSVSPFFGAVFS